MTPLALDGNSGLGAVILLGLFFGVVLVKSDFAWDESCVKFLSLRSGRLLKIFLCTFALGVVGFYFCAKFGIVNTHVAKTYGYSAVIGGIISGIGVALAGFFPGSSMAALGAGRVYAFWVFLGMLLAIPGKKLLEQIISPPWHWGSRFAAPQLAEEAFGLTNMVWPIVIVSVILVAIIQVCLPEDEK